MRSDNHITPLTGVHRHTAGDRQKSHTIGGYNIWAYVLHLTRALMLFALLHLPLPLTNVQTAHTEMHKQHTDNTLYVQKPQKFSLKCKYNTVHIL